jgi:hypothetical protein
MPKFKAPADDHYCNYDIDDISAEPPPSLPTEWNDKYQDVPVVDDTEELRDYHECYFPGQGVDVQGVAMNCPKQYEERGLENLWPGEVVCLAEKCYNMGENSINQVFNVVYFAGGLLGGEETGPRIGGEL